MSVICAGLTNKGKVGVQRGRKTAGCPSFLPSAVGTAPSPPRARRIPALRRAQLPAEVQRKTLRPLGTNPPAAVRVPRSADAEKEPPVRVEPACGSSCALATLCREKKHRRIASTVLKVCTFTQIAAAYRHPYAPAPAGPVPDDRAR